MRAVRRVKLFRDGGNQILRIPGGFELEGEEAILRKEGGRLTIEPAHSCGLLSVLASLEPLDETFPNVDESQTPLDDVEL